MKAMTALTVVLLLGLLVGLSLAGCGGAARSKATATPPSPEYMAGASIYSRFCSGCHGERGEGKASLGPELNSPEFKAKYTAAQIQEIIEKGREVPGVRMESYAGKINNEEMRALLTFVQQLAP